MPPQRFRPFLLGAAALLIPAAALAGDAAGADPRDPWEGYNRAVFAFNNGLDTALLKPAAQAYDTVVPEPVDQGVSNFFANLGEVGNFANSLLQAKPGASVRALVRLTINSTVGLLGLFDIATELGIERGAEDFGQTLGAWGAGPGPYLVLPVLGPSTVRDGLAAPVDFLSGPTGWLDDPAARNAALAVAGVDARADLLETEEAVEELTADKYALMRNAYLDRRDYEVSDGAADIDYELE